MRKREGMRGGVGRGGTSYSVQTEPAWQKPQDRARCTGSLHSEDGPTSTVLRDSPTGGQLRHRQRGPLAKGLCELPSTDCLMTGSL